MKLNEWLNEALVAKGMVEDTEVEVYRNPQKYDDIFSEENGDLRGLINKQGDLFIWNMNSFHSFTLDKFYHVFGFKTNLSDLSTPKVIQQMIPVVFEKKGMKWSCDFSSDWGEDLISYFGAKRKTDYLMDRAYRARGMHPFIDFTPLLEYLKKVRDICEDRNKK